MDANEDIYRNLKGWGRYITHVRTRQKKKRRLDIIDQESKVYVSTQARKSPIRVWSSPVRVQVPKLVWGSSCLGPGLVLSLPFNLRQFEPKSRGTIN